MTRPFGITPTRTRVSRVKNAPDTRACAGTSPTAFLTTIPLHQRDYIARARNGSYPAWLRHIQSAAACSHPVRLAGELHTVNTSTGEIVGTQHTKDMPDGVLYKACGNRRQAVCPSCSETYRADAYQLIKAGITGGKGIPEAVARHPAVFATFTAPSFGIVHTRRINKKSQVLACRARTSKPSLSGSSSLKACRHGTEQRCFAKHGENDRVLGTPLCYKCYQYTQHAVWNSFAGELWRRTAQQINRTIQSATGVGNLRIGYAKVAEFQTRGAVHFHAIIRLDVFDPDDKSIIISPPFGADVRLLTYAITAAVEETHFRTPPHPDNPDGWDMRWGQQLDIRPLRLGLPGSEEISDIAVAGYIAKYATKSTEATGHISKRLEQEDLELYADPNGTHTERLIWHAWHLGQAASQQGGSKRGDSGEKGKKLAQTQLEPDPYARLQRWAHQFGFGGHFLTKTRRYSITFRDIRAERQNWRRIEISGLDRKNLAPEEQTVVIGSLHYVATGWHTDADAQLANATAARTREWKRIAKEERETLSLSE